MPDERQSRKRDITPSISASQVRGPRVVWDVSGFGERLKEALAGRPAAKVARAIGSAPQTFDNWLKGAIPAADRAFALADELGVNERWLIAGVGERSPAESWIDDSDWVSLPRYDLFRLEPDGSPETVEMVRVRRAWISRAIRSVAKLWVAELPSDAMAEVGREGDLVVCENVSPPLVDGRVYIFLFDRQPIVRRVQLRPEGLLLKAGPDVDPILVSGDRIEDLVPVGRVLATISLQAV